MEMYNNTLCFSVSWLIENDLLTAEKYQKMKSRGQLQQVRPACLSTRALVSYESMPNQIQEGIKKILQGDPYEQIMSIVDNTTKNKRG